MMKQIINFGSEPEKKRTAGFKEILEKGKGAKEIHKSGKRNKISCMLKDNGETTNDREEIMDVCLNFYKSLYDKAVETPADLIKTSTDTEEVLPFLEKEIEDAMKNVQYN